MAALCVRCKKNQAVLFVSRMENGEMKSEGYCLKCAKELGMKPIDDVLNNLGLREEDLDAICEQANELLGGELMNVDQDNSNIGETGTENILRRLYGNLFPHGLQRSENPSQEQARPNGPNRQPRQNGKEPEKKFLNAFCIDLTSKAKAGQLDGLIGRETEMQRTMQILNRRLKNNPCLIGEPGVGKTAIVEGLAQRIARGNAPYKLLNKVGNSDYTAHSAVFIDYDGEMISTALFHLVEKSVSLHAFVNEARLTDCFSHDIVTALVIESEIILCVEHTNDVINAFSAYRE